MWSFGTLSLISVVPAEVAAPETVFTWYFLHSERFAVQLRFTFCSAKLGKTCWIKIICNWWLTSCLREFRNVRPPECVDIYVSGFIINEQRRLEVPQILSTKQTTETNLHWQHRVSSSCLYFSCTIRWIFETLTNFKAGDIADASFKFYSSLIGDVSHGAVSDS